MSVWAPKRFWKHAEVTTVDHGFTVVLDGRAVKTPAKTQFWAPTRALADEVAAEWQAQGEKIDPDSMPFTRTVNSALDKVAPQADAVADMLASYGGTDLLCYRATAPQALINRQQAAWDPMLSWSADVLDAPLLTTQGVMPIDQPQNSLDALAAKVRALSPFQLAAFHDLVAISGSLILAFAISRNRIDVDEGFACSRIDEHWQIEQWGADEEAAESEAVKKAAMAHAANFFALCG